MLALCSMSEKHDRKWLGCHGLRIDLCDMGELDGIDRGAPAFRHRPGWQRLGQHDVELEA